MVPRRKRGKGITKIPLLVNMEDRDLVIRNVAVVPVVNMANADNIVRNVAVVCCARPHIVLPEKIESIKDTVCFPLSIFCIRLSLLHGITRQRRTLL